MSLRGCSEAEMAGKEIELFFFLDNSDLFKQYSDGGTVQAGSVLVSSGHSVLNQ